MKQNKVDKDAAKSPVLSAVTAAFVEHGGYLHAFLRRFMNRQQDIEDVAQEAYIRAFKTEQNNGVEHPKALLFTIAKNIAINELRTKARRMTEYIEECQGVPEAAGATTEEELSAIEQLEIYCEAVDELPEKCKRVYLLRKVHGLSNRDTAERLNISLRTVERHLEKGVRRCRDYIREAEAESEVASSQSRDDVVNLNKRGAK